MVMVFTINGNGNNATVKRRAGPFQGFNFGGFFLLAEKISFTITSNSNSSNATVKKSAAPFQGFNFGGFFLLAEKIGRLASN